MGRSDALFQALADADSDPADVLTPWLAKSLLGPHSWTRAVWRAIEQLLLEAPAKLKRAGLPDDAPAEHKRLADDAYRVVAEALGFDGHRRRLRKPFEAYLRPMLRYAFLGYRYAEEIYYVEDDRLWLREWQDREPTAHWRWDSRVGRYGRYLHSVIQRSTTGVHRIHADHLTVLSFDRTGDNYSGVGLAAGLPFWARLKRFTARAAGVVVDQMSTPAVRARVNYKTASESEAVLRDTTIIDRERERAETQAADWQARTRQVVHDSDIGEVLPVQFKLELGGHISLIQMSDAQIAMALIAHFMLTGTSGGRAGYDTAELLGDVFSASGMNILDGIAEGLNGPPDQGSGVVGRIVDANLGPKAVPFAPEVWFGPTNTAPLLKALNSIMQLIQPGALLLDDEGTIDEGIRAALNLPQLPADVRRMLVQRAREQARIAGQNSGGMPARAPQPTPSPDGALAQFRAWRVQHGSDGLGQDIETFVKRHPSGPALGRVMRGES